MIPATPLPDFRSPAFLRNHIEDTLSFYLPRAIDPNGGLFHFLRDDGSVYKAHTRHLVSSTRYVVTLAMAARRGLGGEEVRRAVHEAGLSLLAKPVKPLALKSMLDRALAAREVAMS